MPRKHKLDFMKSKAELTSAVSRYTPEQFKAIARYKGWKYTMLAERWGFTPVWISNIARDPNRPVKYDDMLIGLPNLKKLARDRRHRQNLAALAVGNLPIPVPSNRKAKAEPGYRYRGYHVVGSILTASTDVGSIAEEGSRGIIFQVLDRGGEEIYGVIFENGLWDWFSPDHADAYLAMTGLTAPTVMGYRYVNEVQLQADFNDGNFEFWPTTA